MSDSPTVHIVLPAPSAGQLVWQLSWLEDKDAESLVSTKAPSPTTPTTASISAPPWPAVSMDHEGIQIHESALPPTQHIFTLSPAIEAFCFLSPLLKEMIAFLLQFFSSQCLALIDYPRQTLETITTGNWNKIIGSYWSGIFKIRTDRTVKKLSATKLSIKNTVLPIWN